jgi:hypothetical protein
LGGLIKKAGSLLDGDKISAWKYIPVDKQEFLLYKRCNYPPEEETPVFSWKI